MSFGPITVPGRGDEGTSQPMLGAKVAAARLELDLQPFVDVLRKTKVVRYCRADER